MTRWPTMFLARFFKVMVLWMGSVFMLINCLSPVAAIADEDASGKVLSLDCPDRERGLVKIRTKFRDLVGVTPPPVKTGTGFLVRNSSGQVRIITASHVVNYAVNRQNKNIVPYPEAEWGCGANGFRPIQLVSDGYTRNPDLDIAVLRFETSVQSDSTYLEMAEPSLPFGLYSVAGYPKTKLDSNGEQQFDASIGLERLQIESTPRLEDRVTLSEPFGSGISGSPLRNQAGQVVGILTNAIVPPNVVGRQKQTEAMLFVGRAKEFLRDATAIYLDHEGPHSAGGYIEIIPPSSNDESLVIIFQIQGPDNLQDVTGLIRNSLEAELKPGPNSSIIALTNKWRIEQSRKTRDIKKAVLIGEEAGSFFVITGEYRGGGLHLNIAVTDRSLSLEDEELARIGLRLDSSPIAINLPLDHLSSELVPVAVFLKGLQLYKSGDLQSAETHFSKVVDTTSQPMLKAQAHFLRGISNYLRHQYAGAKSDYNQALSLGLTLPAVYWRRAQVNFETEFRDEEGDLETGIKLSRGSPQSYYVAGLFTLEAMIRMAKFSLYKELPDDFDKANDYLRVAIEKDPSKLAPIVTRVELYRQFAQALDRDPFEPIKSFVVAAIDQGGDRAELQFILANTNLGNGKFEDALKEFNRALDLGAPNWRIQLSKVSLYEGMKDLPKAIQSIENLLADPNDFPSRWWQRANAKAKIQSLRRGDLEYSPFTTLTFSEAAKRRDALQAAAIGWVGKTWNRDFHSSKSTKDFVLSLLTSTNIIAKVPENDRPSAIEILRALLDKRADDMITPEMTPAWCETGITKGSILVVQSGNSEIVKGLYLGAPEGLVVAQEQAKPGFGFQFVCHSIRTDRELQFSGD